MITVYYDGDCGLCSREVKHYKKIAPAQVFCWVDITKTPEPFTALGYTVSDGLSQLHVQDGTGKMHMGVDAFIQIWRPLKRWRLLAFFASMPVIKPLLGIAYGKFARWRLARKLSAN